jgi:hypothetical protein
MNNLNFHQTPSFIKRMNLFAKNAIISALIVATGITFETALGQVSPGDD